MTSALTTEHTCPNCYCDQGTWYCTITCASPACAPCAHDRWADEYPIEALQEEYDRACEHARYAEEAGHDGWRQDAAYAEHLARVLEEIEDRHEAGATAEELEEIARHA